MEQQLIIKYILTMTHGLPSESAWKFKVYAFNLQHLYYLFLVIFSVKRGDFGSLYCIFSRNTSVFRLMHLECFPF